jgi:hypothetical protein
MTMPPDNTIGAARRKAAGRRMGIVSIVMYAISVTLIQGCNRNGPTTISSDRFNYAMAIGDSFKEQNLLNIVRLRYGDWPVFLEVQQVVAGYNWETTGTASTSLKSPFSNGSASDVVSAGVTGRYIERPTITYSPLSGEEFARNLLTPIRPLVLLTLIETGWPADLLFEVSVESANDLRNAGFSKGKLSSGDDGFSRLSRLLRELQIANALMIQVNQGEKTSTVELGFRTRVMSPDQITEYEEIKTLLGLDPNLHSFTVIYEGGAVAPGTIALKTRSILMLMAVLSAYIDVPESHITSGRTQAMTPQWDRRDGEEDANHVGVDVVAPIVRIHSGLELPPYTHVSVTYRGVSYWIDDSDFQSKRVFSYLLMLATVTETGSNSAPPLVITTN